jgi:hypothetical protein
VSAAAGDTRDDASPFSARTAIALAVAGIAAFAAFLLLTAYAGDFRSGRDGRAHALSRSAVGFAGIVQLIGNLKDDAFIARSDNVLETEDLVVVALGDEQGHEKVEALIGRRSTKATLLILPKWETAPHRSRKGWVTALGVRDPNKVARMLPDVGRIDISLTRLPAGTQAKGTAFMEGIDAPAPRVAQGISGPNLNPLIEAPKGGALLVEVGDRPLYILADPDLMNNRGLRDPASARAALDILDGLNSTDAEGIVFDVTLNGFGRQPSPLRLAFEPPFLALTLVLFVAALLAGLHGAFRFGRERREERVIAFGKAALVENSAALIRMARREHRAGGAYAEVIRDAAAHESAAPPSLTGPELEAYLDRISPPGGPRFSDLAAALRAARDKAALADAARALFTWKKDISQ